MPGTVRLYFDDPHAFAFTARVTAHAAFGGKPSVVLDRTLFYPEAGGQMADHGELASANVVDVQVDDDGVVHHRLDGALPAVGDEVQGTIDRARRRTHMALHTGQHMLSRALEDVASASTVSSRLGETMCTIDVDKDVLDERRVGEAEELVNAVIDDDVAVRAWFPDPVELAALPLRRTPKVTSDIRVISIGDFDVSPCGGTHTTSTAQVGLIRVIGVERYKGKARVTFSAGRRARAELLGEAIILRTLGKRFTCGPDHVPLAIDKLARELDGARVALGRARGKVADTLAEELAIKARGGEATIVSEIEDATIELLRHVALRVTEAVPTSAVVLTTTSDDGVAILAGRGREATFDCGAFLKRAAAAAGGRGGGRPEHAEGRLPKGADWLAAVKSALS